MCNQWIKKSDRRPETRHQYGITDHEYNSDDILFIHEGVRYFGFVLEIKPEHEGDISVYKWCEASIGIADGYSSFIDDTEVTYWMPAPELPNIELTIDFVFEGKKYRVESKGLAEDENMIALPDGRILRLDHLRYVQYPEQILQDSINVGGQIPIAEEVTES